MPFALHNTSLHWGSVTRLFHWLVVALVLSQFVLAAEADSLPLGMAKLVALARHKSVGLTVLGVVSLRLLWRWISPVVPVPGHDVRDHERMLARATHWLLYALLFAMPLSGWLMSSAKNYPVSWFSIVQIPDLIAPNERLFALLRGTHQLLAVSLVIVVSLHVLAALYHHFVRKDDVLRRMLPFAKRSRTQAP